jgi:hypothetical protein
MYRSSPQIFEYGPPTENNPWDRAYKEYPILLEMRTGDKEASYIPMLNYIRLLQDMPRPSSDPMQPITIDGMRDKIAPYGLQRLAHNSLKTVHFDFSRTPYSLKKWDPVAEKWNPLTIDCQLMTAAFLVCLDKNLTERFVDRVHQHTKIGFRCVTVYTEGVGGLPTNVVDFIEVTPVLTTPDGKEEHLLLSITDEIKFPRLKITAPGFMATAEPDFSCCICLGGGDIETPKIFRTGCGNKEGHCFHRECIEKWVGTGNESCPVCRTELRYSLPVPV